MNDFLKRLIATSMMKFEDGGITIVGVPMIMRTAYVNAYSDVLLRRKKECRSIIYWSGYLQAQMATEFTQRKYNYKDLDAAYKTLAGQSDMLGVGKVEFSRINLDKPDIVVKVWSVLAKETYNVYGAQKTPIDDWIKGSLKSIFITLKKIKNPDDFICIETKCIAMGDPYCEFVVRPKSEFNLKDKKIVDQIPIKLPMPSELGQNKTITVLPVRKK